MTLFLAGDVMIGRGVDQILERPSPPDLHEPFVTDAREYVRLAEIVSGPVPRGVGPAYIWGDAIAEWTRVAPAARIVNLETSITRSQEFDRGKGIHYRMHPDNVGCLTTAGIDVCAVANNHVLDYGRDGLIETLQTLGQAGIEVAGAGPNADAATRPAVRALAGGRNLVVAACAHQDSGVPGGWAADAQHSGVNLLPDLSEATAAAVARSAVMHRLPGDIVVVSVHWGDNWGYDVPQAHVAFARRLVQGGVDIVHGHSSHHARPIEIYRDRLILYGCGDFINDYEGISGYEGYRGDLAVMYFPSLDPATGRLVALRMTPLKIRKVQLNRASVDDVRWLGDTLNRISRVFGTHVEPTGDGALLVSGESVRRDF